MSIEEASEVLGRFGRLRATHRGYPIETWGWLREIDKKNILFEDNHGHIFIFKMKDCEFKPKEFKILCNETT